MGVARLRDEEDAAAENERDPLVEALMRDLDMSLIQRNLRLTPQQRFDQLAEMQRFASALAEAGRRAKADQ
jgi:hypothetical protein